MATTINWNSLASEYAGEHQSIKNQMCHMIGIPLILLAPVKLTQWPTIFPWISLGLPIYFLWSWSWRSSPITF